MNNCYFDATSRFVQLFANQDKDYINHALDALLSPKCRITNQNAEEFEAREKIIETREKVKEYIQSNFLANLEKLTSYYVLMKDAPDQESATIQLDTQEGEKGYKQKYQIQFVIKFNEDGLMSRLTVTKDRMR